MASGRSYYQHELDRKLYFISKEKAEENTKTQMERVMKTVCKHKIHNGYYEKYTFDTHEFLTDIKSKEPGNIVNWSRLARIYNLVNKKNILPANGGRVLQQFAKENGVETTKFNIISQKWARIRRSEKKLVSSKN